MPFEVAGRECSSCMPEPLWTVTRIVAGPAEHANVVAALVAQSPVGEVVNRERSPPTVAILAASADLHDPQPAAQSPEP
jgi:hypothetical protein